MKINVLMMQKDEGELLASWLQYYSHLFGWSSLYILDNGSTDSYTCDLLREAKKKGANLYTEYAELNDFHNKGTHFSNIIKALDQEEEYDFALPVDCDEFLAVFKGETLSLSKADILEHFETLKGIKKGFRIDMSLWNVPNKEGWYAPGRPFHKGFIAARTLKEMDHGQHNVLSKEEEGVHYTAFTYLHCHNRPYAILRKRHQEKLRGILENPEDMEEVALHAQRIAAGAHLAQGLMLSRRAYLSQYDKDVQIYVTHAGGSGLVSVPGAKSKARKIFFWDEKEYLAKNPDVACFYSTALNHFLRHGFEEGRPFLEE